MGSLTVHLGVGEHEDGRIAEIWFDSKQPTSFARGVLEAFAGVVSIGLQYGVPLQEFVDYCKDFEFEPAGALEGDVAVTECKSILDAAFRVLEDVYLKPPEVKI
jgi:hypothetical protein